MTRYVNVMLVLQNCSDTPHILTGSSSDTNATSYDCAYHVGNVKFEEHWHVQEEEREANVKTEKDIGSEEEECIGTKDEQGMYSEEEDEEEVVDIKEEVSVDDSIMCCETNAEPD